MRSVPVILGGETTHHGRISDTCYKNVGIRKEHSGQYSLRSNVGSHIFLEFYVVFFEMTSHRSSKGREAGYARKTDSK